MSSLLTLLEEELTRLRESSLYRKLSLPEGLDFCSNDYLGISQDPALLGGIKKRLEDLEGSETLTSPASRLLRGNTCAHERLERRLARWKHSEAALLFPSGYQANLGLLTTLLGPEDRALSDEHNHASLIDGLRLSRCQKVLFRHSDPASLKEALSQPHPAGRTVIVTESLFSMDGDIPPLSDYVELADHFGAGLVVDEAHATGIFGSTGAGLLEEFGLQDRVLATISTFGKALGLAGAAVTAPETVIELLINRCRCFMFTTALPPLWVAGIETSLDLVTRHAELRRRLIRNSDQLRTCLKRFGFPVPSVSGPILPILIGDNQDALRAAERLQRRGFDVRAVRPPTVPVGTARLRISVHANHKSEQIQRLAQAIAQVCVEPVS